MDQVAVRLQGLVQKRAHFQLGPIDLVIPAGYVTAIVGPNGSGKSSLFRLILDLAKPDRGEIEVLGKKVGSGDDRLLKQRIGYVSEKSIDIEENLRANQKADFERQWYPDWDVNRYQELLRRFDVETNLKLGKMSKGMRRKFDIALAMAHNPELLLLDEPSSGLDPIAWKTMIDVIHRYMERGDRTVVMASHIVDEVKRLADYIAFVIQGKVIGVYEKDSLLESWHVLYVDTGNSSERVNLAQMPGYCSAKVSGGTTHKVVTSEAQKAQSWLASMDIPVIGQQKLELDEILQVLMEQTRGA
ncbi:ABC transporter [Paenibacillus baekrokdamisoli]|uniref:ABC transporter n=1 Tax=Paenibacillus baekrokdamisoli TaxID=1712516 RepID=A0A3G9JB80_9BACL|nr:ABC transporter ATP-binding protein [Paenibacillus baekrokdamisoli]MBB3070889.1 ABC-2 type transport system ATP-binding protein [Paenibacillus baekrokdamisoli]BBH22173.1 ABC transporter [Paenibacillus baekrokdamisoli]